MKCRKRKNSPGHWGVFQFSRQRGTDSRRFITLSYYIEIVDDLPNAIHGLRDFFGE